MKWPAVFTKENSEVLLKMETTKYHQINSESNINVKKKNPEKLYFEWNCLCKWKEKSLKFWYKTCCYTENWL